MCPFLLQIASTRALHILEPVFRAAERSPKEASEVVTWLILAQGDSTPATTMWALWQRFADDFVIYAKPELIDDEFSEQAKMLRELFLGGNWQDARDWMPLHGEAERLRKLFVKLPATQCGLESYAYFLAKTGTPTLPGSLVEVAQKIDAKLLTDISVFYFEDVLTRLIYTGNSEIRVEPALRNATLRVLDALIAAGSSRAYKLRDDFLTPMA